MKDELTDLIKRAQTIVENSEVKDEFAISAFEKTLQYLMDRNCRTASGIQAPVNDSPGVDQRPLYEISYSEFIETKQPKNDYEITACIVYLMTEGDVSNSIKKDELIEFIHQNPGNIKGLKNLNDVIKHTRSNPSYSYIETKKEGNEVRYRLSAIGKQLVDRLPERKPTKRHRKSRTSRS